MKSLLALKSKNRTLKLLVVVSETKLDLWCRAGGEGTGREVLSRSRTCV